MTKTMHLTKDSRAYPMGENDWRFDPNQPRCKNCGRWIFQVNVSPGTPTATGKWYHQRKATTSCLVAGTEYYS